jgi:hypothetical protein
MLIDMHLVEEYYPAIFESLLYKLFHGNVPSPGFGPLTLLKELGSGYVIHCVSQLIWSEGGGIYDNNTTQAWDWISLRSTTVECYERWYSNFKSDDIYGKFSRTPKEGEFFDALKHTMMAASFYAKTIWSIICTIRKQGMQQSDAYNAIVEWSTQQHTSWYSYVQCTKSI